MGIVIPNRLRKKLSALDDTYSCGKTWLTKVENSVSRLDKILASGRSPAFFIEYTDHGVAHINNVLKIADKLITDDTLDKISVKTVAIIVMGILLHDIGMFVNYEAFESMLEQNVRIHLLDRKGVKDLWLDYLQEFNRYSERELIERFGTKEILFKALPEDKGAMSDYDKMVIGEFLRRIHHKVSHYLINSNITIDGQENSEINELFNNDDFNRNEIYFIGMVARSHGENIRKFETSFNDFVNKKSPDKVDIYYAMAVLSISDLLDAGEERASHIIQALYVSYSNISKGEFEWNQCFNFPSSYDWNILQQSLIVTAEPKNAFQYSKTVNWISYAQMILDKCWALISEYYDCKELSFSIRRITSNLFLDEYIEKITEQFYPKEIYYDVNPDITKLLIHPLYGDDPTYGIRELLQNSLDACRERSIIEYENGNNDYHEKISINVNTKNRTFSITDNGIGMTADIIINYFLRAGASFIDSEVWRKSFLDETNHSKVIRNGRFGVGVLSALLLGDEIIVTTRSISDNRGWQFIFKREQYNIELNRVSCEVGTTIRINLKDDILDVLKYDPNSCLSRNGNISWNNWFYDKNDNSIVEFIYDDNIIDSCLEYYIDSSMWHEVTNNEFYSFCWCVKNYPHLCSVYNNLVVPNYYFEIKGECYFYINVIDKNNKLPLSLDRTQFMDNEYKSMILYEYYKYKLFKEILLARAEYFDCVFQKQHFIIQDILLYGYFNIDKIYDFYRIDNISECMRQVYCTLDSYQHPNEHEWEDMQNITNNITYISKECKDEFLMRIKHRLDELNTPESLTETDEFFIVNVKGEKVVEPEFILNNECFVCERNINIKKVLVSDEFKIALKVFSEYIPKDKLGEDLIPISIHDRINLLKNIYLEEYEYIKYVLGTIESYNIYRYYSLEEIENCL